ncbi:STM3941 family protein [Mucilaginibacter sp.]|uniref:STM3941 family protein n=1 Tax=Mucilaginibacter sp. TaxID=1882438 RepID=UPI00260CB191|nr:STM3941 family protein [Mucilaginibacter sp.]MDB4923838.1 hypothetical protein [Mucilaginibacter sp.]
MEFKIRYSNTFVMNMSLIIIALLMASWDFISPTFQHGFLHYKYILWLVLALVRFLHYRKYIYLGLANKPVLIVNETYIYDLTKNIKYYWEDIKEVYERNAYLYINLYKPDDYLDNFHNPIKKLIAKNIIAAKDRTPYNINIDLINVNPNVFLEILDDYSIRH